MEDESQVSARQLLTEYETLRNQAQAYEENLQRISSRISELQATVDSMKEMEKLEGERESLVPIGSGAFVSSKLSRPESVILDVGAGLHVKKPLEEAERTLQERIEELEGVRKEHSSKYQEVVQRLQQIAPVVQQIVSSLQQGQTSQQK